MSDLIDRDRALRNLNGQTLAAPELAILDGLITAASTAIENHCRRSFNLVNRDERHDGQDDPILLVHHYPVAAIERVACNPTAAISIRNESPDVQRASVRVIADGIVLTSIASGITTVEPIDFADAVTLDALAAAVADIDGWSATVLNADHGLFPSADLAACPGTWSARAAAAQLRTYAEEVFDYELDARLGVLRRILAWPGGASFYRILYTAGYATVPDDIQEACAQLAAQLFWQTKRDPGLAQEAVVSILSRSPVKGWSSSVRDLLGPYRRVPRV